MDDPATPSPEETQPPADSRGLLDALLDMSFTTAITPKIIKTLYILGLIAAALFAARWAFTSFDRGIMQGISSFVFAPIVFILYALLTRIGLEIVVAVFRILEHLKSIDRKTK